MKDKINDAAHDAKTTRQECYCENSHCDHGDKSCGSPDVSGKLRLKDLGPVCFLCYANCPEKYHVPLEGQS